MSFELYFLHDVSRRLRWLNTYSDPHSGSCVHFKNNDDCLIELPIAAVSSFYFNTYSACFLEFKNDNILILIFIREQISILKIGRYVFV